MKDFLGFIAERDPKRITELEEKQDRVKATFEQDADARGIENLELHTVAEHEGKARHCHVLTYLAHGGGCAIAMAFSYKSSESPLLATLCALLLYVLLAYAAKVGLDTWFTDITFIKNFKKLSAPPICICFASGAALIAERFATSPYLVSLLADLDPYIWMGLELSALALGAIAHVGADKFGWSGRHVAEFEKYQKEINGIYRSIELRGNKSVSKGTQRGQGNGVITLPVLLLAAVVSARSECPTVMIDQTGSVADLPRIEANLASTLSVRLERGGCVGLITFSDNVYAATRREIVIPKPKLPFTGNGAIVKAVLERSRQEAERIISEALGHPLPSAICTSLPDMLTRAADAESRTLLVTDALHERGCGPISMKPIQHKATPLIVLVRSKSDAGSNDVLFQNRSGLVLRLLPEAPVFPEYKLGEAVQALFEPGMRAGR